MKELYSTHTAAASLHPLVRTADANGATIDLKGYNSNLIIAHFGASGDTLSGSVYALIEIEESDDNSTWTDVADEHLTNTVTGLNTGTIAKVDDAAEDDALYIASYIGHKRYIRPVLNLVGTHTNGIAAAASVVRGAAQYNPVN